MRAGAGRADRRPDRRAPEAPRAAVRVVDDGWRSAACPFRPWAGCRAPCRRRRRVPSSAAGCAASSRACSRIVIATAPTNPAISPRPPRSRSHAIPSSPPPTCTTPQSNLASTRGLSSRRAQAYAFTGMSSWLRFAVVRVARRSWLGAAALTSCGSVTPASDGGAAGAAGQRRRLDRLGGHGGTPASPARPAAVDRRDAAAPAAAAAACSSCRLGHERRLPHGLHLRVRRRRPGRDVHLSPQLHRHQRSARWREPMCGCPGSTGAAPLLRERVLLQLPLISYADRGAAAAGRCRR